MYSIYKTKPRGTPIEDTEWGKDNPTIAEKSEKDVKPEDTITILEGDQKIAPYVVRKGAGAGWLAYCQKPVIKVVGVFDTVGSLGYPKNIFVDVTAWNEAYQFHDTDIHPGKKSSMVGNETQNMLMLEQRSKTLFRLWHLMNAAPLSRRRSGICLATIIKPNLSSVGSLGST